MFPGMDGSRQPSHQWDRAAADKAAIVRNILISISSNIELCLLQYCL
jgi:hypothetical protein